ncbi:chloride channel protein [Nibricoccus aquaticus]|uniref:Chloride channel protein n=1 Tax=Nibricoccus aquaticus TaxID=2576891 RepID=A0A290QGR5_9BACT|nr:chloride channel protein [Nibricoccus aquaticus]ATC63541.1 chloride channel protein [Nibricoccus aquaticus]
MSRAMPVAQASAQRPVLLCVLALAIAGAATVAAHGLLALIGLITNAAFYGRVEMELVSPAGHGWGAWVIAVPVVGAVLIVALARWGTRGILGHGIPEVMEQVLTNRSRIAPRVALLKPVGSAISIGTGGPYGAEGPVIAMGGAIGSLLGQALTLTAVERKILLCAGGAAAMTAVFGSPLAATLLAVELLLFEFKARSLVPVMLAATFAQALRVAWGEAGAVFPMGEVGAVAFHDWLPLVAIGVVAGALAVAATAAVHGAEAIFAKLGGSWMWRPVVGGLIVGVIGWWQPRIFGAGYEEIAGLLGGHFSLMAVAVICGCKLAAWVISLGSGSSGGTLAPMLMVGGGVGVMTGALVERVGGVGVSPGLAALAGMVAFFAGGSRAFFASIVLGVEITQQSGVLWPVATAATGALFTARLLSQHSIMTAPVTQRGVSVPAEFDVDVFAHVRVSAVMEPVPQTVSSAMTVNALADRIGNHDPETSHHQALLVADEERGLVGIITRKDLLHALARGNGARRLDEVASTELVTAFPDEDLHDAVTRMHQHDIGRLPVVARGEERKIVGYLGRAAILSARRLRWEDEHQREPGWLARKQDAT